MNTAVVEEKRIFWLRFILRPQGCYSVRSKANTRERQKAAPLRSLLKFALRIHVFASTLGWTPQALLQKMRFSYGTTPENSPIKIKKTAGNVPNSLISSLFALCHSSADI